ncbi:hypothetical protein PR048_019183 [Dryococelus australis]|uniref:Uncharacterized protein n=1 Tax=Dryococelus australis TaxID=614101 RepID=A0ABQ9H2V7_9NEOP|nr:hypothetical protein PR048_019183 [Dryococelus australis]
MYMVRAGIAPSCYKVQLNVEGLPLEMELDTGAAVIPVLGQVMVNVKHNNQFVRLPLLVVKQSSTNMSALTGSNWLEQLKLDCHSIFQINLNLSNKAAEVVCHLRQKYADVFKTGVGTIKGHTAVFHLKPM